MSIAVIKHFIQDCIEKKNCTITGDNDFYNAGYADALDCVLQFIEMNFPHHGWVQLSDKPNLSYDVPVMLCNQNEYQEVVIGKLKPRKSLPFHLQTMVDDDAYFDIQNHAENSIERIALINDFTHYMPIVEP